MELSLGDKLKVPKDLVIDHVGIFVGAVRLADGTIVERAVVHNSKVHGSVVLDTVEGFAVNGRVEIVQRAIPGTEHDVVQRALALLGRAYDLTDFNCEHAANLAQTGVASSPQLSGWAFAAGALLFAGGMIGLARTVAVQPRYDDRVGVRRDPRTGRFVGG